MTVKSFKFGDEYIPATAIASIRPVFMAKNICCDITVHWLGGRVITLHPAARPEHKIVAEQLCNYFGIHVPSVTLGPDTEIIKAEES